MLVVRLVLIEIIIFLLKKNNYFITSAITNSRTSTGIIAVIYL